MRPNGHVAEWLRSGLQNRLPRFNSGRGLQASVAKRVEAGQMVRDGLCGLGKPRFDTPDAFKGGTALLYAASDARAGFSPVAQR